MRIDARTLGLAVFSGFAAALTATSLYMQGASAHAAPQGMIAAADARKHRLGFQQSTPVPVATPHLTPRIALLPTPTAQAAVDPEADPESIEPTHESAVQRAAQPIYRPTALEVAGNPHRYVGDRVHWTCVVDLVPQPTFADAKCGPSVPSFAQPPLSADQLQNDPRAVARSIRAGQDSLHRAIRALNKRAMIVLTGPVANLDHGQTIVIDGTVRRPIRGENAFGVTRAFPTVHIDGIARSRDSSY